MSDAKEPEPERVARAYGAYAQSTRKQASWSASNPGNAAIRNELVDAAFALAGDALRGAAEILDAGCGTGWWLERLAAAPGVSARLHGLDVLPERVAAAAARVPAAAVQAGEVRSLPYEDGRFGAVTLFTVLSSLADDDDVARAAGEAYRVLAAGGALLIWEPRIPNPTNASTRVVSLAAIRAALPGASLDSITLTLLPAVARRLGARTGRLYPRLARVELLRSHRLLCVRRRGGDHEVSASSFGRGAVVPRSLATPPAATTRTTQKPR